MTFDKAIEIILHEEGGYVNDPKDPGGETKYGISKRSYPNVDIKNLTVEQAKTIYKKDYWDTSKCNDILNDDIKLLHFDTAVNMGVGTAIKTLQTACGVTSDGVFGEGTKKATINCDKNKYFTSRMNKYLSICEKTPTSYKFLKGWLSRLFKVYNQK